MKILIDIGHPAHVHLLKNFYFRLKDRHKIYFSVRDIKVAKDLLNFYEIPYIDLGAKKNSLIGKALTVLKQDLKLLKFVLLKRIDLGISSGIVLSHLSKITPMKSIVLDDDDDISEPLVVKYGHPFTDYVLTPTPIIRKTKNAIYHNSTHELAYLHPDVFSPDRSILEKIGLSEENPFFILRFVAFKGHHDGGHYGISFNQKLEIVNYLKQFGKVLITSEKNIEPELEEYRIPIKPEEIHSLMSYAKLFIGDSQTMISEAAILGVPSLKCNTFAGALSIPNELEKKYELCYSYHPDNFEQFFNHIKEIVKNNNSKQEWQVKRERFLSEKINLTDFLINFVEKLNQK
jgi:predicted glycosyltransferase